MGIRFWTTLYIAVDRVLRKTAIYNSEYHENTIVFLQLYNSGNLIAHKTQFGLLICITFCRLFKTNILIIFPINFPHIVFLLLIRTTDIRKVRVGAYWSDGAKSRSRKTKPSHSGDGESTPGCRAQASVTAAKLLNLSPCVSIVDTSKLFARFALSCH